MTTTKTYTRKSDATKAAKKALGAGQAFTVSQGEDGRWSYEATNPKNGGGKPWRIGFAPNPKTGKDVNLLVSKTGAIQPHDRKRVGGAEHVPEWTEVRAASRSEAVEKIEAGEGVRFRRTRTGKAVEAPPSE